MKTIMLWEINFWLFKLLKELYFFLFIVLWIRSLWNGRNKEGDGDQMTVKSTFNRWINMLHFRSHPCCLLFSKWWNFLSSICWIKHDLMEISWMKTLLDCNGKWKIFWFWEHELIRILLLNYFQLLIKAIISEIMTLKLKYHELLYEANFLLLFNIASFRSSYMRNQRCKKINFIIIHWILFSFLIFISCE